MALPTTADQPALLWERFRPRIDAALSRYAQFDDGCPAELSSAIRYALLAPGKRLRPQLVLMAAEACGGEVDAALPAACAVEMVHAYSLVHDDLPAMDDDDLRRGRPTCHKEFGEAMAILVGDALLARAFEVLAGDVRPAERAARCCAMLAQAAGATALVGGQAADLAAAGQPAASGQPAWIDGFNLSTDRASASPKPAQDDGMGVYQLESIHRRKTGALFVASLQLGAITAGAAPAELAALERFGRCLGLAFQITDDLLDVAGSEIDLGKRVAKDAERGKLTFPRLLGVDESRRRVAALVDDAARALEPFGPAAEPLRCLAHFVSHRKS